MTEIILTLTVSIISMGMFVFIGFQVDKFLKFFIPIMKEILDEQKKNK